LQEYGQILRLLGDSRLELQCMDGVKRMGHIRGKMRKKVWMAPGDIVLVALREYEKDKCDIILKYNQDEIMKLKKAKEIPESLKVNEDPDHKSRGDDLIEFERKGDTKDDDEDVEDDDDDMMMMSEEEEEEEDSDEEKKEVKKKEEKKEKKEDKKPTEEGDEKKHEEEESVEEETEDISKYDQNSDILNDLCKQEKKPVNSILSKTSYTAQQNSVVHKPTTNYNKPAQNNTSNNKQSNNNAKQGGKKKFVEIDLKNI